MESLEISLEMKKPQAPRGRTCTLAECLVWARWALSACFTHTSLVSLDRVLQGSLGHD